MVQVLETQGCIVILIMIGDVLVSVVDVTESEGLVALQMVCGGLVIP